MATVNEDIAFLSDVQAVERKVDNILESGMFRSGIFLPDEATGLMHKVTVTRDAELNEENISVNKEGVP